MGKVPLSFRKITKSSKLLVNEASHFHLTRNLIIKQQNLETWSSTQGFKKEKLS